MPVKYKFGSCSEKQCEACCSNRRGGSTSEAKHMCY